MKIFTNNSVYVQKNDIAYLNCSGLDIPASIFMKVFGKGIVIIDDSNRYEFIEFNEPHEVEFFSCIDWIVDYNAVKDLSENEMIDMAQKIIEERNKIVDKYNSMSEIEREKNYDLSMKCDLLEFKMYSLRDILWYKQGHLKMNLPFDEEQNKKESKKGFKNFVKRMFEKKEHQD